SNAACEARANDTSAKLVACVKKDDLWAHMQAFWQIAQDNPGPDGHPSLNSGEPGYKAAADRVASLMRQAGYDVTEQPYTFDCFVAGRIALIQRGTCTFSQKIANAQAAGATGVIIFNEGNTAARSGVFSGSLSSVPPIPVAFVSFAEGQDLYNEYQDAVANGT